MSRLGMDIDAVESFARKLETGAVSELATIVSRVSGTVGDLTAHWSGQDAQAFSEAWQSHLHSLGMVQSALDDLVSSLDDSVRAQRLASGQ